LPPSLREVGRRMAARRECPIVPTALPQSKIRDFCQPPQGGGQGVVPTLNDNLFACRGWAAKKRRDRSHAVFTVIG
jgi:hypothetical protein